MSDLEDEDLKKFLGGDEDVKPIDIGPAPGANAGAASDPTALPAGGVYRQDISPQLRGMSGDDEPETIKKGDYIDLLKKDPTLRKIILSSGWEQRSMGEEKIDMDMSLFLLDKNEITRNDSDFVFYNQPSTLDGGVRHMGDNRTGAGEGDDESFVMDLNALPFDIFKVMIVISIYDEMSTGLNLTMVRDVFVRIVNEENLSEVCRFVLPETELTGGNALYMATMIREGSKWIFEALGKPVNGGLAEIASKYGLIVKELQSTG